MLSNIHSQERCYIQQMDDVGHLGRIKCLKLCVAGALMNFAN